MQPHLVEIKHPFDGEVYKFKTYEITYQIGGEPHQEWQLLPQYRGYFYIHYDDYSRHYKVMYSFYYYETMHGPKCFDTLREALLWSGFKSKYTQMG